MPPTATDVERRPLRRRMARLAAVTGAVTSPLVARLAGGVPVRDEVTEVDGVDVLARHAATTGAPVVVLVHGMVVSSRYFVPTLRELAGTADAWAPDLPGFGRSGPLDGPLTIPALADRLVAWMAAAGVEPAVLVGNSVGCQIAVHAAVRHPASVRALVLNGPTTDPAARSAPALVLRWLWTGRKERASQGPLMVQDYLEFGGRRAVRLLGAVLDDAVEDVLPRVTQPAVVVRGEHDAIVPRPWAEEVVRLLPRGRLVTVPGGAHTLNFTHPSALAAVVDDLLGGR